MVYDDELMLGFGGDELWWSADACLAGQIHVQ
jgi:hypothetical protein